MPTPLLNAYADQLPRITAEESLQAAQRYAVGAGTLRRGQARQIISAWQRASDRPTIAFRPATREVYDAHMAVAGIKVKRVAKADG